MNSTQTSSFSNMMVLKNLRLKHLWWGVSLLYLTLMGHLLIYRFVQGQCTSTSCMALTVLQVGLGVSALGITLMLSKPFMQNLSRYASKISPSIFLALAGMSLLVLGLNLRPEWVYVHISLAMSGFVVALYITVYGAQLPTIQKPLLILLLLIGFGAWVGVRALALGQQPSIHILDEPWTLSWAVSYLKTGQPSDWILGSVSGSPYYSLPRYYGLVALWLEIFGVGLWQGRLFSLFLTALAILFTTLTARNLFNRQTALITLGGMCASYLVFIGLRLRHDVGVTFAIALSVWCYSLTLKNNKIYLHALAGLCAGLGVGAHYHALGLCVALGIGLYFPQYVNGLRQRKLFPSASMIAFILGGILSGGLIFAIQVLPNVEQFQTYLAPRSPRSLTEFVESLGYHIGQIAEHSKLEFVFVVIAFIGALLRRTRIDMMLALTVVMSYLALGAMASKNYGPFDYYSVPLTPILGLLIAGLWFSLSQNLNNKHVGLLACFCFLAPQLGYTLQPSVSQLRSDNALQTPPAAQWVLDHVPVEESILGEHLYFLWLYDYPFLSPLTPDYLPPDVKAQFGGIDTLDERLDAWAMLGPDVLIFDPNLATSGFMMTLYESEFLSTQGYELQYEDDRGVSIYRRSPTERVEMRSMEGRLK